MGSDHDDASANVSFLFPDGEKKEEKTKCCDFTNVHNLFWWKGFVVVSHFVQACALIAVVSSTPDIKDYKAPVNLSYLEMVNDKAVYQTELKFFEPTMYPVLFTLFALSIGFGVRSTWKLRKFVKSDYGKKLPQQYSCIRWVEHAWSSSLILSVLQGFTATTDAGAYVMSFMCNAAMAGFLGLAEYLWFHSELGHSNDLPTRTISNTLGKVAFLSGLVVGLAPWVIMFGQYEKSRNNNGSIPAFVTWHVVIYFLLTVCFSSVMIFKKCLKKESKHKLLPEFCYTALSSATKVTFIWLVVGGISKTSYYRDMGFEGESS
jgi:hypothetical protein